MAVRRSLFAACGPFQEVGRGADSLFVYRVMEERLPQVVRYVPAARIRHLEITSAFGLARKKFIYGQNARRYAGTGRRRRRDMPADLANDIVRRCVRNNGYSLPRQGLLFGVVAMTKIAFKLGGWSAREAPPIDVRAAD
jgi:hypothetical protein